MTNFNTRFYFLAAIIYLTSFGYSNLFAQQSRSTINAKRITSNKTYPPGVMVSSIANKDSTLATFIYDPNENIKIIVQFKTPPLAALKIQNKKQTLANIIPLQLQIENEHSLFKNDLTRIESNGIALPSSILKSADTKVKFEYKTAINGMAISTKRWVIQEIEKLPYVKAVYEDKVMKALDDASNNVIGADSVWAKLGLTGAGIKIGILDTGIDYKHPDLGGGFGPAFKVIGGYDFINNDNDPMDDYGHGTHVAGIAAANGQLKGVAPDAKLYAFKVLDNTGSGPSSTIIAGIDRAMDPDNNPATNDAVNIISMSLGGPGDPDDPLSQAIDNATAAGIICVIAAGNSGSYQTIGSPGCARTALTVGATDNSDNMAYFSSRGPSNKILGIKPDVVAPGVSINSTKLGGGYISMSGTSMATPHIAGCAALILQLHPDWTPAMVKAVLMESAKDVGQDIWTQGHGRVNLLNAFSQSSICVPATISLGIDDVSQSVWTIIDTLKIYNNSSVSQTYSFSNSGNSINGVSVNFSVPGFNIEPNQNANLIVTFTVNNNIVQNSNSTPPAYTGNILIHSNQDILIPYSFIKSPLIQFNFDDADVVTVFITPRSNRRNYWAYSYPGYSLSALLPPDIYDVLISYSDPSSSTVWTHIVKENINLSDKVFVSVSKKDAQNTISFNMLNEQGEQILMNNLTHLFINSYSDEYPGFNTYTNAPVFIKTSNMSSNTSFEWAGINFLIPNKMYKVNGLSKGINQNMNFKNDPNLYRHFQFKFEVPVSAQSFDLQEWIVSAYDNITSGGFMINTAVNSPVTSPIVQDAYYMLPPNNEFSLSLFRKGSAVLSFISPVFQLKTADSLFGYLPYTGLIPVLKTTSSTIPINFGPPHWFGKFSNSSSGIKIIPPDNSAGETYLFCNQSQDYKENGFSNGNPKQAYCFKYHLYSNSILTDSGFIKNKYNYNNYFWQLIPGTYSFKIDGLPNSYINNRKINATVTTFMDTRKSDPNPPTLHSLNILSDGEYVNIVDPLKSNQVQFNIDDDNGLKNVLLELQCDNDTYWQNINLIQGNSTYTADIPVSLKKGFVSLRISGTDNSDNKLVYDVEPAFMYGVNHAPVISSLSDTTAREDSLFTTKINASDVDGDSLKYFLTVKPSWLSIDSTKGILTGTPKKANIGNNNVTIKVKDSNNAETVKQYIIIVLHTNHAPIISSKPDTTAKEDSLYTYKTKSSDPDGDSLRYSFTSHPNWLNIDSIKGIVSGKPDKYNVGDTIVIIKVSDRIGGISTQKYNLLVFHTNHKPYVTSIPGNIAKQDTLYSTFIKGRDSDSLLFGDTVSYNIVNSPSWLNVDTLSGHIYGTPGLSAVGKNNVNIVLSDGKGGKVSYIYTLDVLKRQYSFQIIETPGTVAYEDSLYKYQILARDSAYNSITRIDGKKIKAKKTLSEGISYELIKSPLWISIDSTLGVLEGIPGSKDVGKDSVKIRIRNLENFDTTFSYELTVIHTNHPPTAFSLVLPKDKDTLQLHNPPLPLAFKWNSSKDIDINDSLRYDFNISGPGVDTSIAGIKDTSLSLNIMPSMKKQSVYNWKVSVSDGVIWTASADSFYLYTSAIISGNDNKNGVPAEYSLSQNYPNPFNPVTTINYALPKPGLVSLKVYNILGQEVAVLVNEEKKAGNYSIKFPSNNIQLSSGVYLYKIQAGDFISVKKLILLK